MVWQILDQAHSKLIGENFDEPVKIGLSPTPWSEFERLDLSSSKSQVRLGGFGQACSDLGSEVASRSTRRAYLLPKERQPARRLFLVGLDGAQ